MGKKTKAMKIELHQMLENVRFTQLGIGNELREKIREPLTFGINRAKKKKRNTYHE